MRLLLLTAAGRDESRAEGASAGPTPVTAQPAGCPLPALDLLPHTVDTAALDAPLHALVEADDGLGQEGTGLDAILLDGTADPRGARAAALALAGRTAVPRVALLGDASLAALSPEWAVADFLTPGASAAEVDARLRLLAHAPEAHGRGDAPSGSAIEVSGIEIDESNFVAKVHGRTLDLTYKEYELLHFLALNPARVFTREQLLSEVWNTDYFGGTRTVDVHVRRLRAKLGEHEWLISTVRGVGYGFARGRQE